MASGVQNDEFSLHKFRCGTWERGLATGISGKHISHFRSSVYEEERAGCFSFPICLFHFDGQPGLKPIQSY